MASEYLFFIGKDQTSFLDDYSKRFLIEYTIPSIFAHTDYYELLVVYIYVDSSPSRVKETLSSMV